MATKQDVRDFTNWHIATLFCIRHVVVPAMRRGVIDEAIGSLTHQVNAPRPNVDLRAMAEVNEDRQLAVTPLGIAGQTAHAAIGQLTELLFIELRETQRGTVDTAVTIEFGQQLHPVDAMVGASIVAGSRERQQSGEMQSLAKELEQVDFDDLDRRLPLESNRLIATITDPRPTTDRVDTPDEDEIAMARQLCRANPGITWDNLRMQMEIGGSKATALMDLMRNEGLVTKKKRRRKSE